MPPTSLFTQPPPTGLIDMHSHLLPGIDDGCQTFEESLACITRLKQLGYVGTICTPHVDFDHYPENTPEHIHAHFLSLQQYLASHNVSYQLWFGGELRIHRDIVNLLKQTPPPTLVHTRCVLVDFWDPAWPKWTPSVFEWLLSQKYQPILAHPERLPAASADDMLKNLLPLEKMGVWLQGNFRCMTGEEGYLADRVIRKLLEQQRYKLLALDMHRPDSLESRLDGLSLVEAEFGPETITKLTSEAPRKLLFTPPSKT